MDLLLVDLFTAPLQSLAHSPDTIVKTTWIEVIVDQIVVAIWRV